MASTKKDQRIEVRFLQKSGMSQVEIGRRLRDVHGAAAISQTTVRRWFQRAEQGKNLKDQARSGQPKKRTPENIQEATDILNDDRRTSLRGLSRMLQISKGTTHKLLHKDLEMTKKSAKWVPHLLTDGQKQRRVLMAWQSLAMMRRRVNPINQVVMEDESWICAWEPESNRASKQWLRQGEPRPEKVCKEQSTQKVMLTVFFDEIGMIHYETTPTGLGIGGEVYRGILGCFVTALEQKRPDLYRNPHTWALLHDGAPAHRARVCLRFLGEQSIQLLPHPGYSPDLTPADFWFFNRVKEPLRGIRFRDVQALIAALQETIDNVQVPEFAAAMDRFLEHLHRCIAAQGSYFERS